MPFVSDKLPCAKDKEPLSVLAKAAKTRIRLPLVENL